MKMYILILDESGGSNEPLFGHGKAIVAAAHASLACYLKFADHPDVASWLSGPFYKAVCLVSPREFNLARDAGDYVSISESSLGGKEVALAFRPREEYPKAFKFFRLYK